MIFSNLQKIDPKDTKYQIVSDGKKRILRVNNVNNTDEGRYTCKVQDKESTAKLYVAREWKLGNTTVLLVYILSRPAIDISQF